MPDLHVPFQSRSPVADHIGVQHRCAKQPPASTSPLKGTENRSFAAGASMFQISAACPSGRTSWNPALSGPAPPKATSNL
jgi:hypothetical protein